MNRRGLAAAVLEVIVWGVAVWYSLPAATRTEIAARSWNATAQTLRVGAEALGLLALEAERRYYLAVQP